MSNAMRYEVGTPPVYNEQIRTIQETLVSCARKPFGHRKRFQGTGGGFLSCGHFQSVFIPFPKLRGNYRVILRNPLHDSRTIQGPEIQRFREQPATSRSEGQSLCPDEPDFMSDQGFGLDRELEILTDHFLYLTAVSRECNHVK
jgi:hypothetical protein